MITSYSLGSPPTPPSTRLLASSGALETHLTLYKVGDRQHLSRMHVRLFACSPGESARTDYVWNVKLACRKHTIHTLFDARTMRSPKILEKPRNSGKYASRSLGRCFCSNSLSRRLIVSSVLYGVMTATLIGSITVFISDLLKGPKLISPIRGCEERSSRLTGWNDSSGSGNQECVGN
jgi:hypothetical protein